MQVWGKLSSTDLEAINRLREDLGISPLSKQQLDDQQLAKLLAQHGILRGKLGTERCLRNSKQHQSNKINAIYLLTQSGQGIYCTPVG